MVTIDTPAVQEELRKLAKLEVKKRFLDYKPYKKQRLFHTLGATKRERALMAGNQLGKVLKNQTLILRCSCKGLTEWVEAKDVKVGDYLVDSFGNPTRVLAVYPHKDWHFYRLTFDDGTAVLAGGEHLWKAKMHKREKFSSYEYYTGEWGVYSTDEIIAFGGMEPCARKRAYIPVCEQINTAEAPLPVDPYVLGQYLGNGHSLTQNRFHITEQDDARAELVKALGDAETVHVDKYTHKVYTVAAQGLIGLGLQSLRSWEKFIPRIYLHASHEQRKALLQGLMDTDGSCTAPTDKLTGGDCEYSTASEQLAKDITELARSLGCKVKIQVRQTRYTYQGEKRDGRTSYRVKIRCPFFNPFRLERKAKNWFRPTSTTNCRVLYKIEDAGYGDGVCFTVDSPDHTYIIQDYIVTHNTLSAAYEMAFHLTGRYPSWWEGRKYTEPVEAWAGGVTSLSVRDIIQDKLFGKDWRVLDDGILMPDDVVGEPVMARGVPGLIDTIKIKHVSGGTSILQLKSYEQGREKWQGTKKNIVWLDEEPPVGIYAEALARTNAAVGGMLFATFTPLMGMTEVVLGYWDLGPYQGDDTGNKDKALVLMGINDVEHYTPEQKQTIIASYPSFEREARANGIPSLGSGRVFKYSKEQLEASPMPSIPDHWPRIAGIDIGWDHPTAVCWLAWDKDTDTVYLYDCYKESQEIIGYHAGKIRSGGDWIPVAWPMDALQSDKQTGQPIADIYREFGVNMLYEPATLETEDGKLTNSVEASLFEMDKRMQTGRFKVAPHLEEFFEEISIYHRDKGKIVKIKDDLISACRYAIMMLRYAETKPYSSGDANYEPNLDWIV